MAVLRGSLYRFLLRQGYGGQVARNYERAGFLSLEILQPAVRFVAFATPGLVAGKTCSELRARRAKKLSLRSCCALYAVGVVGEVAVGL